MAALTKEMVDKALPSHPHMWMRQVLVNITYEKLKEMLCQSKSSTDSGS